MKTAIVWFRHDLRLRDNPALSAAVAAGYRVLPVFIDEADAQPDTAQRWWLHHALHDLQQAIEQTGGTLCCCSGDAQQCIPALVEQHNVEAVFWNRCYNPSNIKRDTAIKSSLKAQQLHVETFNGGLINEPWEVLNQQQKPYRVFTPYWRACQERLSQINIQTEPANIQWQPCSSTLPHMLPRIPWDKGFYEHWTPQRSSILTDFQTFIDEPLERYETDRDRPDRAGTTRLSPYLQSGQIGVRELVVQLLALGSEKALSPEHALGRKKLLAELGWREFSAYLLFHFPHLLNKPLNTQFEHFPWQQDKQRLNAWQRGQTGYPIVDAGMMQLWHTGWMHNRVRMIVASFLVKHLLQPWQSGAEWFMHTLVDADVASNTQGWQWVAGCGADAAPYFRIFNPVLQAKKFDPNGTYVREWLPALRHVPERQLQEPWLMSDAQQRESQCIIGQDYPEPIIDLKVGRDSALAAWQTIRG